MAAKLTKELEEAVRIANCEHRSVLPFHRVLGPARWHCANCGGEFNQHPGRTALSQHQGGTDERA